MKPECCRSHFYALRECLPQTAESSRGPRPRTRAPPYRPGCDREPIARIPERAASRETLAAATAVVGPRALGPRYRGRPTRYPGAAREAADSRARARTRVGLRARASK